MLSGHNLSLFSTEIYPGCWFHAKPESIGATKDEWLLIRQGGFISFDRVLELQSHFQNCAIKLHNACPLGTA